MRQSYTHRLLVFVLFIFCAIVVQAKNIVIIHNPDIPLEEKEAFLILSGFGSFLEGTKDQKRYFGSQKAYDLYIPDYISRKDVAASADNLERFFQKHQLRKYKRIHVVGYIVGSWTINTWLRRHKEHNIATLIYDRSPYQERAPSAMSRDRPLLMRLLFGRMMKQFSQTPYPPYAPPSGVRVGIIVETRPTKLIRKHMKSALLPGPIRWDKEQFEQSHMDAIYLPIDHDDMYHRFDVIGPEILHFIQNGAFTPNANRQIPSPQ